MASRFNDQYYFPAECFLLTRQWGASVAESGTFNEDPYQYVVNPNDYLNFDNIESDDPLRDTRINATNEHNLSKSNSLSANANIAAEPETE